MSSLYQSTQQAWHDIWQEASIDDELAVLNYPRAQRIMDSYTRFLPREGLILEAGSGLAATVVRLRALGYHVIGLDYVPRASERARQYDPTLELQAGDVHALPYRSGSLHGYLSFGVLEHFEHGVAPALNEASRVLVPGGILVLTIPSPNLINRLVHWRRKRAGQALLTDETFYESTYTHQVLAAELDKADFDVLHVEPVGHSFTLWGLELWGLGALFRGKGYYETTILADWLGGLLRIIAPWTFGFSSMLIGQKRGDQPDQRVSRK